MSPRIVELEWKGPFTYGKSGLEAGGDAPHWATDAELESTRGKPGLYLFCVDHPIHGRQSLAYIGQSSCIGGRLDQHDGWLRDEWAHSPIYNSKHIHSAPQVPQSLHIRNVGRFWGLFPDVCAGHPWHHEKRR